MENLELTYEERLELEKRGFFIQKKSTYITFIKSIFSIILTVSFIAGVGYILIPNIDFTTYSIIAILCIMSWYTLYQYVFSSSIFYTHKTLIWFWEITSKASIDSKMDSLSFFIYVYTSSISFLLKFWRVLEIFDVFTARKGWSLALIILPYIAIVLKWAYSFEEYAIKWTQLLTPWSFLALWYSSILYALYYWWIFSLIWFLLNQIITFFRPLYAFGNLWEKIQKLTPTIEEQSMKIRLEFESTMDFSVLNKGFELLSRNFSEIVRLIIKLEKAEKRANQWNLFDSEKYINSLRSDIVTPLIALKTFLEEKKIELIQSKQELTRVRVWWNEETGNIELQSKRSDPLILELTENIEKLDVMIGKMG
jgi:hypothetical protein